MPSASTLTAPENGLPDTKVGIFSQALYDEAKAKSWTVTA
jgi:hypothetical protein